ncbi:nucleotide pyrophosphohydrolase [Patescibacteria group bacterium]
MTNLNDLIKRIDKFNKARGWAPVSSDIAKSVVIEASELLEHFQWDESDKDVKGIQPKNWEKVGEEVADVFWYLVTFCHSANLNLEKVVQDKVSKNEKKYPAKVFNGKHNDKFYKEQKKYREARKVT